jgi:hypothetical protein
MKSRTRLALQQAAMRSRPKRKRDRLRSVDLKPRIAATVLAYERGYSAADIARLFKWPLDDVTRWFEAGRPLL